MNLAFSDMNAGAVGSVLAALVSAAPARRTARRRRIFVTGLCAMAALASPAVDAKLRLKSHQKFCRVVVTVDSGRSVRVIHDGPVRRQDFHTFSGRKGVTVCVQRNEVPEVCDSRLTRPQCMVDPGTNRTQLFTVR